MESFSLSHGCHPFSSQTALTVACGHQSSPLKYRDSATSLCILSFPAFREQRQEGRQHSRWPCTTRHKGCGCSSLILASLSTSETENQSSGVGTPSNRTPSSEVLQAWQEVEAVCFDVDSTVCTDEGIDELAAFCQAGDAVAEWTRRAMGGGVPFEEALAARLAIIQPSTSDVANFLANHPPSLSPGIKKLVDRLVSSGKDVYLVSGGFRLMIEPVAELLGIPRERIFANTLKFAASGEYEGFDATEFTSRSGGKAEAIAALKQRHGYKSLAMVGDGATDLEARKPGGADLFIGYGGVQVRKAVEDGADWFVFDLYDLVNALEQPAI